MCKYESNKYNSTLHLQNIHNLFSTLNRWINSGTLQLVATYMGLTVDTQ